MRPPAALLRPPSQSAREPFAACSRLARGPHGPLAALSWPRRVVPVAVPPSKLPPWPLVAAARPSHGPVVAPSRPPCDSPAVHRGPAAAPFVPVCGSLATFSRPTCGSFARPSRPPVQPISGPVAARSRPSRGPVVSRASSARGFPTAAFRPSRGAPGSLVATPRGAFEGPLGAIRRSRAPWRCASLGRVARDWRPVANASSPPSSSPEDRVPLVRPWFC